MSFTFLLKHLHFLCIVHFFIRYSCSNLLKMSSNSSRDNNLQIDQKRYQSMCFQLNHFIVSASNRSWSTKLSPKMEVDSVGQMDRSPNLKRSNNSSYEHQTKKIKNEPKEKMSSELLHQLISNNHQRGRPKSKGNWLLDTGGKAACISQPSDSVLMNLLVSGFDIRAGYICLAPTKSKR